MKIAVLSGKGGTGKTFVSVNLAAAADQSTYIDCDVEEPNGHLFLKPENPKTRDVSIYIPVCDQNRCTGCRQCVEFCKFNALAYINGTILVYEDICHACGGCVLFCPAKAMTEKQHTIGQTTEGTSGTVTIKSGMLTVGEISGVPIIRQLLQDGRNKEGQIDIIDCPPGNACTTMESIQTADFCLLVAEPTTFGLHNLKMSLELVRLFDKPHAVVLNKCLTEDDPTTDYCEHNGILVLERIPYDRELGMLVAQGCVAVRENETYREMFNNLLQRIQKEVPHETVAHS